MTEPHEKGLLGFLDSWRLAVAISCVALALLTVFSVKLWVDLRHIVDARAEEFQASNSQQVERCFGNATQGPALRRVLVELEMLARTERAKQDVRNFLRVNEVNTPTIRECRQLADNLGVNRERR